MCCSKPRPTSEAIPEFSQLGFNFRGVLRAHSNKQLVDFLKVFNTRVRIQKHHRRLDQLIGPFDFFGGENGVYRRAQRVIETLIAKSYLRIRLLKQRRQESIQGIRGIGIKRGEGLNNLIKPVIRDLIS